MRDDLWVFLASFLSRFLMLTDFDSVDFLRVDRILLAFDDFSLAISLPPRCSSSAFAEIVRHHAAPVFQDHLPATRSIVGLA